MAFKRMRGDLDAPNCLANRCSEVRIFPEDIRCLQPILPNAFLTVSELCREQLQTRYGGAIPETARERIEYELAMLRNWMPLPKAGSGYRIPYGRAEDFSNLFRVILRLHRARVCDTGREDLLEQL